MVTYLVTLDDLGSRPSIGDITRMWFLFSAKPEESKPLEKDETRTLKVELSISDELLACGGWKELEKKPQEIGIADVLGRTGTEIELQAFAFVQDNLQVHGLPSEKSMPLSLDTRTEHGRFAKGPDYDPKKITKTFKVVEKTPPIGFKKPTE
jgi:hypothetical protein